jgi:hypothetical protein
MINKLRAVWECVYLRLDWLQAQQVSQLVGVEIRGDVVFGALERFFRGHTGQHEHGAQAAILTKENIRVETVANHANLILAQAVLVGDVVQHERGGLTDDDRLLLRAAFNSTNHGTVTSPFLGVGQVRHGIRVRGDEQAPRVFTNAQRGVLNLVVVDVTIETDDNRTNVFIVVHQLPTLQRHLLASISFAANVLHADVVELLQDARLADDVRLLLETNGLQVRRRRERTRENLFRTDVEPQRLELARVPSARLGRVVCHENQSLPHRPQQVQRFRHAFNQRVPFPNHPIAIENKRFRGVHQRLGIRR